MGEGGRYPLNYPIYLIYKAFLVRALPVFDVKTAVSLDL